MADDDDLDFLQRRLLQRLEDAFGLRKKLAVGLFGYEKLTQLEHVWAVELTAEVRSPAGPPPVFKVLRRQDLCYGHHLPSPALDAVQPC